MHTSTEIKPGAATISQKTPCPTSNPIRKSDNSRTSNPIRLSIPGLVRELKQETKAFVRQELTLAKTEMSEKLGGLARNSASVGIGSFIAYAGVIVLLIALAFLAAWAIHLAGLDSLLASFLGLFGIGLLTAGVGVVLLFQGLAHLRKESLAPERTIRTLQGLKGEKPEPLTKPAASDKHAPKVSSAEMQRRVERTEVAMGETLAELGDRVSPRAISRRVSFRLRAHPYRSGLVALVGGLLGGWLVRRRFQHT